MKNKRVIVANLLIVCFLSFYGFVLAEVDTDVQAEDLGVTKAKILPGNPFYGFKNIFRGVQEGLARNPMKKAELQWKHANEKVIEAKQLVEEKGTPQAQEDAVRILKNVNNDFGKIVRQSENFSGDEEFLSKIADQSLKQQVILQKLQEQVPEEVFTKIEQNRQEHLEKFGQVMTRAIKTPEQMRNFLPQVVENQKGSNFKELKAVEILRDLEDKVSPEQREALRMAQQVMSQKFEQRFANMPQEARQENFQNYVGSMPGNPVRQFEAFETMRQNFQSPEIMQEIELAKDRAVQKFESRFSQFQGEEARQEFMAPWRNGDPEDLRTMTEMKMRLDQIPQGFQQFQQETQNNFQERFSNNPEALRQNPVFQRMAENPDVVDLKMTQGLGEIPAFKQFQNQATEKFIENVQRPGQAAGQPVIFGPPVPGGLRVLEEIRGQLPIQAQRGMDQAIQTQTKTMENYLGKIEDSSTFQRYKQQIEGDQMIRNQVQQFAPRIFQQQPSSAGQQPSPSPRPIVPMTPERVQLFEEKQPIQQLQEFQQSIQPQPVQPQPAPALEPAPPPVFPNILKNFLGAISEIAK
ncbi:MAG: hypothetical protein HYV47_02965 [Candidatus Nealsonbacteria bacterium]|nr:hypothetical protein [Candidatus Nealsonbacteria bacterium]